MFIKKYDFKTKEKNECIYELKDLDVFLFKAINIIIELQIS